MKKISLSQFLDTAKEIHANFYDYSEVTDLPNTNAVITITCPEHGTFQQRAFWHMRGHKCKACGYKVAADKNRKHPIGHQRYVPNGTIARTLDDYIKKFSKKHGNKYDYSLLTEHDLAERKRTKSRNKIKIICPKHGVFEQVWDYHRGGNGCQSCKADVSRRTSLSNAEATRLTKDKFVERAKQIHNGIYDYTLVNWINVRSSVSIVCAKHGIFRQVPAYHLDGAGCQMCAKYMVSSKMARSWFTYLNIDSMIMEYKIHGSDTNYVVDGFDPQTNTVYEFLGDYWHGNPAVFDLDQIMTKRNVTFRDLYEKTMQRMNALSRLGYNVIYIWEHDWKRQERELRSRFACS